MIRTEPDSTLEILWAKFQKRLRDLCEVPVGVLSCSLLDLKTGNKAHYNENVVIPTASTIKIAVLLGLATRVHAGGMKWDTQVLVKKEDLVSGSGILTHLKHPVILSVWDHASLMVSLSDNTATNICIRLAGMEFINEMLSNLGLRDTRLKRIMMDYDAARRGEENVSTSAELVELVRRIEERDGIADVVSTDVLTILGLPKTGPFRTGLPSEVKFVNKPGGLGNLSVDAGLIYLSRKTFALAVMGTFLPGRPDSLTVPIVKAAYEHMELLNKCTGLGRS